MPKRRVPDTASVTFPQSGAKLSAPSAARNAESLCELLTRHTPLAGHALEIASGTGQHIVRFAATCPQLHWQPSEIDPTRLASIDAYVREAGLGNLQQAIALDATALGWGADMAQKNLIIVVNLLHLISLSEVRTMLNEVSKTLIAGGVFIIYGPFMRGGELTSPGDKRFHDSLITQDADIGYKDDFETLEIAFNAGLELREVIEMPANNLALVLFRPN